MNESEVKKLFKDLGISKKDPTDFDRTEEFDFFPEYGHIAWRRLKV